MSCTIHVSKINIEQKTRIIKDLTFRPISKNPSKKNFFIKPVYAYSILDDIMYIPLAYSVQNLKIYPKEIDTYHRIKCPFVGTLREEQRIVKTEAIKMLNQTHTTTLSFYCGFGKTVLGLYLACKIGLRTIIVVHRIILINQWKEAIESFVSGASVQVLDTKTDSIYADFCIVNSANVSKIGYIFNSIGTVIVDECHTIATKHLSRCLHYLTPRYMIALSATPTRPDGMDKLMHAYFGKDIIFRQMYRTHTVFRVDTQIFIQNEFQYNGTVDWNSVLEKQSTNAERNNLIINIVSKYKNRTFLILCKRVAHAKELERILISKGEITSCITGAQNKFDQNSRIILATVSKVGCGFSHNKLDALLIAADVQEYFTQYLGRVFRTPTVEPIVFDLVDINPILENHWVNRKDIYVSCGGKIKYM